VVVKEIQPHLPGAGPGRQRILQALLKIDPITVYIYSMDELTVRQQQVLAIIRESMAEQGFPPTRAEIAAVLGFRSVNAAEGHIKALIRKGYIERLPGTSRGIRPVEVAPIWGSGLPLIGRVAAGSPILAQEHVEAHYRIADELFEPQADYLLRVKGMSMRDAGILDGDLLAVHRTTEVENNQIVVARMDDEVTVKRFERHGNLVRLLAENPDFPPIEIDTTCETLTIEGVAVGVIRNGRI
jgi:repressor LexA